MKLTKILAAALAASTIAGSAFAADLPSRKVAPAYVAPAPIFTWTGFYIGLNAGYGWGNRSNVNGFEFTPAGGVTGLAWSGPGPNQNGFVGGAQAGFNYQIGSLVAGIETDIQGAGLSGSTSLAGVGPGYNGFLGLRDKTGWYGTLRGRLGFTVMPTLLAYITGGLAYGEARHSATYMDTVGFFGMSGVSNNNRIGYTLGGGLEYAFSPNWSAKLEYGYVDLGSRTANLINELTPAGAPSAFFVSHNPGRTSFHTVRAGINYRFGWGGAAPVVAKY